MQTQIHALDDDLLSIVTSEGESKPAPAARSRSDHLESLEQQLRTSLGAKVDIKQGARGRGRITVHFTSNEEFERLMSLLTQGQGTDVAAA